MREAFMFWLQRHLEIPLISTIEENWKQPLKPNPQTKIDSTVFKGSIPFGIPPSPLRRVRFCTFLILRFCSVSV